MLNSKETHSANFLISKNNSSILKKDENQVKIRGKNKQKNQEENQEKLEKIG